MADVASVSRSAPDLLFDPSPAGIPGASPLPWTIVDGLMNCEGDVRYALAANTILTGGGAHLAGLQARFEAEIADVTPAGMRIDLVRTVPHEACLGPFLGGSIVGSLPSFDDVAFSRADWSEKGAALLHKRIA
jgi:actin-related protein